jgi:hypothetical protein
VYKVLGQTVPDSAKTPEVREMELYLRTMIRAVDSTLEDEWMRMRDPAYQSAAPAAAALPLPRAQALPEADLTRDRASFVTAIRSRMFTFLRAWAVGHYDAALSAIDAVTGPGPRANHDDASAAPFLTPTDWTVDGLKMLADGYRADHGALRLDPEARNIRHTHVIGDPDDGTLRVQQVLVDPDLHNDWMAEFVVDLERSRREERPVVHLISIAEIR